MANTTTLPLVTDAASALARYEQAMAHDQLVQSNWHDTAEDGRWLACALGVIGDDVTEPDDCPASVMPTWLAQAVPYFFDSLPFDDAKDWGLRFYQALASLKGDVPFRVYHRWMADCVLPVARDAAEATPGADDAVAANKAMAVLHARAAAGDMPSEEEWSAAESAAESAARSAARSAAWSAARSAAESAAVKTMADGLVSAVLADAA